MSVLPSSPSLRPQSSQSSQQKLRHLSTSTGPYSPSATEKEFLQSTPRRSTIPTLDSNIHVKQNALTSMYSSLNWMFGFREKYTLIWAFIFGGALLGFCLARSTMFDPHRIKKETTAGEFFWFDRPYFKVNYLIHIYLTLIGGIMVGPQFFPAIRRRAVILHRLNGYFVLFCLIPGNICGSLIAIKSYGGEINVQLSYYLLGIMITFAGSLGWYNVKRNTVDHRKWMLRMVSYFCAIITARIIMSIARVIITELGSFYSVWRCDQILYVLTDVTAAQSQYPQCFSGDPSHIFAAVLGSVNGGKLGTASATRVTQGMALWTGMIAHVIGVEIYIRKTETANHSRYGYALEPADYTGPEHIWEYK